MALQITAFNMLNLADLPALVVEKESSGKMCHLTDLKKLGDNWSSLKI